MMMNTQLGAIRGNPKVGFTCSCFDLFHAGHVMMLKEAKTQCDYLIVGLQTDPTLDRPQKNKPVQSVLERFIQIDACKYVDQIIPYATEKELLDILTSYPIDVRIIGEEYRDKNFTGYNLPMETYFNSRQHSFSTTELRQRVFDASLDPKNIKVWKPINVNELKE
jgi:glycerol-3-phosphate cytidylyltransferase